MLTLDVERWTLPLPADMSTGQTIPFPLGVARILSLGDLQNLEEWTRAFAGKCKDHRFYEIVEQTLDSKFEHSYLLLEDKGGKVRAIQPLFFVDQIRLWNPACALCYAIPAFPTFPNMRVLMVGNAAGNAICPLRAADELGG